MGKHVDRAIGSKPQGKNQGKFNFDIGKDKSFQNLVERVGNLELAVKDLTEKMLGLKSGAPVEEITE